MHNDNLPKGIALSLFVWFVFTIMTAVSKDAQKTATIPMILLVQNLIGVLLTLPYIIKHHIKQFSNTHFKLIFIRSITGQLNFAFLLLAVNKISLANAMLLNNTAPILVPLISWLWLKINIEPRIWPGIFLGFLGVLLILKPNQAIFDLGAFYALTAAIFLSIVMISLRLLSNKEHPFVVIFYFFLTGLIVAIPLCFFFWQPLHWDTLLKLISIGLLMSLGQYILVISFRYAQASQLAPFSYSAIVYSLFFDWIFWHIIPDAVSFLGILFVCIGGILTLYKTPLKPQPQI